MALNEAVPVSSDTSDPNQQEKKTKRIGDRLVEKGLITPDQLNVALHEKQKSGRMIGETLVTLGFLSEDSLTSFLAETTGFTRFDPKKTLIDPDALQLVAKKDALKYQILPISIIPAKNEITIAMVDPYDVVALDKLKQMLPRGIEMTMQICSAATIIDAIHRVYGVTTTIDGIQKELAGDKTAAKQNLDNLSEEEAYSHPIVRLVNAMVFEAVKMGVSDLHFEPEENFVRIRYRLDGDLVTTHTLHREYWNGIGQRLKIMSQMNITDKQTPQDGRFSMNMGGRDADFRVAALPTIHGENIVLRVLDKNASIVPLANLAFSENNMRLIQKCLARPEGIIIVTGPTGSGKTTTLYSMINAVNTPDVNIMTLEDPVEYSLGLIRQTNVREQVGFNFGEGVKALLRQDPDIIFIGEVRDDATAEQMLKAAMTGHQVFTTLHTNDSFGAIPRLINLGLQPEMVSGAIIACFAQRLVRKICQKCKTSYTASPDECKLLAVDPKTPPTLYKGAGCSDCNNTGYKGRVGVHEILYIDDDIETIIASNGHKSALKAAAYKNGFKSMRDDGILKVYEGLTTLHSLTQTINFADRL
ncbi:MAG: Flp pilus assembly complex ATPase component TadA [Proteobacteria bacterium]|nr:Flp pilus assembly complex ATPase component TadA [Pseudomonadota bacterium]